MRKTHKKKGFTLIEILVVITVMGILVSIILYGLGTAREKSRDEKRGADMEQLKLALATYKSIMGEYPPTDSSAGSMDALDVLVPTYISEIPDDPQGDGAYAAWSGSGPLPDVNTYYYWGPDTIGTIPSGCTNTGYLIWYHLEGGGSGDAPVCVTVSGINSYAVVK